MASNAEAPRAGASPPAVRQVTVAHRFPRLAERRPEVEALLRDESLTMAEIARRLGVQRQTLDAWNRRHSIRPPSMSRRAIAVWPAPRRAALLRLLSDGEVDAGDVAEAIGFHRAQAPRLLAVLGGNPYAPSGRRLPDGPGADETIAPQRLRALLRAHIGRQIALFDEALAVSDRTGLDSAKVLRDLGGLKRLLDDLGAEPPARGVDGNRGGGSDGEPTRSGDDPALDLDGLRAEIARRYDRFVGGGAAG